MRKRYVKKGKHVHFHIRIFIFFQGFLVLATKYEKKNLELSIFQLSLSSFLLSSVIFNVGF